MKRQEEKRRKERKAEVRGQKEDRGKMEVVTEA